MHRFLREHRRLVLQCKHVEWPESRTLHAWLSNRKLTIRDSFDHYDSDFKIIASTSGLSQLMESQVLSLSRRSLYSCCHFELGFQIVNLNSNRQFRLTKTSVDCHISWKLRYFQVRLTKASNFAWHRCVVARDCVRAWRHQNPCRYWDQNPSLSRLPWNTASCRLSFGLWDLCWIARKSCCLRCCTCNSAALPHSN